MTLDVRYPSELGRRLRTRVWTGRSHPAESLLNSAPSHALTPGLRFLGLPLALGVAHSKPSLLHPAVFADDAALPPR